MKVGIINMSVEERREYNRLRKQKQREREKQQSEKYLAELEEKEEREIYKTRNLHFFGEESPGVDGRHCESGTIARLRRLRSFPVPGENHLLTALLGRVNRPRPAFAGSAVGCDPGLVGDHHVVAAAVADQREVLVL